ncbi:MAG: hypothetical protein K0R67_448 [Paenibacillus sp.]|jgi:hypothetical protein|nr:hypothetical protein [Paenibacillus sp.]
MIKTLSLILWSFLAGHLLLIFSWSEFSIFRYIYSLGALFIGIYFFKKFESKWMRINFVLVSIVFYFILTVFYVIVGKIPFFNLEPPGLNMEQ